MLDNVAEIYTDMNIMMKKLKKKPYETNSESFRNQFNHYFKEMTDYVGAAEDKNAAAAEVGEVFSSKVKERFANKRGKVNIRTTIDLNMFTIYYVFPSILLLEDENSTIVCDNLRDKWNEAFGEHIDYTDYKTLHDSFREKIFGIF